MRYCLCVGSEVKPNRGHLRLHIARQFGRLAISVILRDKEQDFVPVVGIHGRLGDRHSVFAGQGAVTELERGKLELSVVVRRACCGLSCVGSEDNGGPSNGFAIQGDGSRYGERLRIGRSAAGKGKAEGSQHSGAKKLSECTH